MLSVAWIAREVVVRRRDAAATAQSSVRSPFATVNCAQRKKFKTVNLIPIEMCQAEQIKQKDPRGNITIATEKNSSMELAVI